MSKTILLARPHPFIVTEMKPILEKCGYNALRPESVADLDAYAKRCDAAIISLAVYSDIEASAEEVAAKIRQANSKTPIIFASLLSFDRAEFIISRLLQALGVSAKVVGTSNSTDSHQAVASSVLYLAKDDLTDPALRARAEQLLRRYIG
ncbi:hypothetical protein [Gilvimarinus polysaccharolyticus]|uniref:hypothetical protein n=1 Tax=Gilvimarinus polysaccharolyticus TaxID=863921 RepID=UPI0006734E86|nr:hypothetical protein [Gilvimarinus polysaccharolyticus]